VITVHVHHLDPATGLGAHVADVTCPADDCLLALDHAWNLTQNINGSWSRGPTFDNGSANPDHNAHVIRIAPLPVLGGKLYGLRSSMVGDQFEIGGRRWAVAASGFQEVSQ
jgi:hypothetical protein